MDSGVLAALCVSCLLKTCKHILSCTEYFVCEHIMPPKPPKPAMMAACLEKGKEIESRTVIYLPAALATLRYEAVRSIAMLFFTRKSHFSTN